MTIKFKPKQLQLLAEELRKRDKPGITTTEQYNAIATAVIVATGGPRDRPAVCGIYEFNQNPGGGEWRLLQEFDDFKAARASRQAMERTAKPGLHYRVLNVPAARRVPASDAALPDIKLADHPDNADIAAPDPGAVNVTYTPPAHSPGIDGAVSPDRARFVLTECDSADQRFRREVAWFASERAAQAAQRMFVVAGKPRMTYEVQPLVAKGNS